MKNGQRCASFLLTNRSQITARRFRSDSDLRTKASCYALDIVKGCLTVTPFFSLNLYFLGTNFRYFYRCFTVHEQNIVILFLNAAVKSLHSQNINDFKNLVSSFNKVSSLF